MPMPEVPSTLDSNYLTILDSIDAIIYVADMDSYELLFLNRKARETSDANPGDICWKVLQQDQSGPCPFCTNKHLLDAQNKPTGTYIWEFQNTQNQEWWECRDQAVRWSDGRMVRLEIATNISHRKIAQQEKQVNEQRLQLALDSADLGTWDWNPQTGELFINERWAGMLGYKREELQPHVDTWSNLLHPEDAEKAIKTLDDYIEDKVPNYQIEFRMKHKSGAWKWVFDIGKIIDWDDEGRPTRLTGIHQDVTNRKEAEEALKASEEKYRGFFENTLVGVFESTLDGRYINANKAFSTMMGYDSPEQLMSSISDISTEVYQDAEERKRYQALMDRQDYASNFIHSMKKKDGSGVYLLTNSRIIRNSNGEFSHYEGVCIDISELKVAQDALQTSEENLQTTLDSIGDAVIATDTDKRVVRMNPVAAKLTGWAESDALGLQVEQIFKIIATDDGKTTADPISEALETGRIVTLSNHTTLIGKDGQMRQIADSAAPIRDGQGKVTGAVLVFRDVTEEYRLREQMQRIQQLEQIGTLAGGIAHDFNNILSGFFGSLDLARFKLPDDHPALTYLDQAEVSAERAKKLTGQLLTFAKGGEPLKSVVDLGELVQSIAAFDLSGSNVKLVYSQDDELWPVEVDQTQIQQAISNLVINATQAMPDGGHLYVKLQNFEQEASPQGGIAAGRYVRINIIDEGKGIAPAHLARIFTPYFSTRQTGRGLGLATVHSVIVRHKGHIDVTSRQEVGTNFIIYLPVTDKPLPTNAEETGRPLPEQTPGALKILLMDDEEAIRSQTTEMLENLGHKPAAAAHGQAALSLYRKAQLEGKPFDLVILDLTVPGEMGGQETIQELLAINPEVRAIVSSGYADDPIMARYADHGFKGVATKPYTLDELKASIRQALF